MDVNRVATNVHRARPVPCPAKQLSKSPQTPFHPRPKTLPNICRYCARGKGSYKVHPNMETVHFTQPCPPAPAPAQRPPHRP